uniref:Retrotransposon gag domain-containing protein n=1 Tax=Glossina pallidipes TaxID=7398 RepID=A0A1B0AEF2_GLOPL
MKAPEDEMWTHGSGKGLTVECFIFRIERLRQQQISHEDLFAEFHCLVVGQAKKWCWQQTKDREGDSKFDYFSLKAELLNQFKAADSDYKLITEVMEQNQQQSENFEDYYAEIHDLTFRLRRKTPQPELIKIMKSNVKPSLATLISATKEESVAELKAECKRAEKLLRESRARPRHINEVEQEVKTNNEARNQTVEAFAARWEQTNNKQLRERRQLQPTTSRADQPRQAAVPTHTAPIHHIPNQLPPVAGNATQNTSFCQSPFHLTRCYVCANGNKTSVTGLITLPVEWEGETRDIEFDIVPELRQEFYFGIDFWKTFGLSVATKAGGCNSNYPKSEIKEAPHFSATATPVSFNAKVLQINESKQISNMNTFIKPAFPTDIANNQNSKPLHPTISLSSGKNCKNLEDLNEASAPTFKEFTLSKSTATASVTSSVAGNSSTFSSDSFVGNDKYVFC